MNKFTTIKIWVKTYRAAKILAAQKGQSLAALLHYLVIGDLKVEIKLYKNGPIIISQDGSKVALCRCGQSADKLTCDGSHVACQSQMVGAEVVLGEKITVEVKGGDS